MDWKIIYFKLYCKNEVDFYIKIRIIFMNGIEVEVLMFFY